MNLFSSIHRTLQVILGGMAAVLVLTYALSAKHAWERHGTAQGVLTATEISRDLFEALQNLRVERGTVNTALNSPDAATVELRGDIAALRTSSDAALAAALAELEGSSLEVTSAAEALQNSRAALAQARQNADAALGRVQAERPAQTGKSWLVAIDALAEATDDLYQRLSGIASRADPFIAEQMITAQLALTARTAAGTDRGMIAEAIAGAKGLPADEQRQLAVLSGRMEAVWKLIDERVRQPGTVSEVKAAFADGQRAYFSELAEKRKAVVADLIAGQAPAISGDQWMKTSNPALKSVIDVGNVALEAAQRHAAEQVASEAGDAYVGLAVTALFLALGLFAVTSVSGRLVRPITTIIHEMRMVARGDLRRAILFQDRQDEVGELARALAVFRDTLSTKLRMETTQREDQQRKEQRQRAVEEHITAFERSIRALLTALAHSASEMRSTSQSMSATAEQTDRQASAVSSAATEASANVETVATAAEELVASVTEIGRQVAHAADIANTAVSETRGTDTTVQGLSDAAHRIGEVVQLINDIAAQTNLLALNATIEAARAGDAGRGFAVVASEVKSLATQTGKATDDIAAQVASIQDATRGAVNAIKSVGQIIEQVRDISTSIASAVEEQGAATKEITRSTQEAARGATTVSSNIAGVSQGAGLTGRAADQVLTASGELSRTAEKLRAEIDAFLDRIRAA